MNESDSPRSAGIGFILRQTVLRLRRRDLRISLYGERSAMDSRRRIARESDRHILEAIRRPSVALHQIDARTGLGETAIRNTMRIAPSSEQPLPHQQGQPARTSDLCATRTPGARVILQSELAALRPAIEPTQVRNATRVAHQRKDQCRDQRSRRLVKPTSRFQRGPMPSEPLPAICRRTLTCRHVDVFHQGIDLIL